MTAWKFGNKDRRFPQYIFVPDHTIKHLGCFIYGTWLYFHNAAMPNASGNSQHVRLGTCLVRSFVTQLHSSANRFHKQYCFRCHRRGRQATARCHGRGRHRDCLLVSHRLPLRRHGRRPPPQRAVRQLSLLPALPPPPLSSRSSNIHPLVLGHGASSQQLILHCQHYPSTVVTKQISLFPHSVYNFTLPV